MTPNWDVEVDVVCAGSGLGGTTAAIMAHDGGCQVVIIEKAPKLGGVCAYSGGEVFVVCNHKMEQEGKPDDPALAKAYLDFLAGGFARDDLARILFDTASSSLPLSRRSFPKVKCNRGSLFSSFIASLISAMASSDFFSRE